MNQENFGKFIKEIRKKNNLTQKQLADKYNVTYQAVSKWENGKNMPDMALIKQISEDFNVSLEDMFEGKIKKKSNHKRILIISLFIILIIIIIVLVILLQREDSNFSFKTLTSACDNFNISGNIAYNNEKSSIYITDIEYCGEENNEEYEEIECTLYEKENDIAKEISSSVYNEKPVTLEEYLQTVTLTVMDYQKMCKEYADNSLYLTIDATDKNGKTTSYNVPLSFEQSCAHALN